MPCKLICRPTSVFSELLVDSAMASPGKKSLVNDMIQHLLSLYGKVKVSNQKLRAVDAFNKGMRLRDIACELCVQLPTAEVYLIDSLVAGKDLDHERLGEYLLITNEHFLLLRDELLVKPRLSMVKQSYPSFTYNQIRFVLACLIRDLEV